MKDTQVFTGKNFTDLLRDIHDATLHKRKRIDELILDLRKLIQDTSDAAVFAPIIANYLEVMVKNDEHLVKVAAIIQRVIASEKKSSGGLEDLLSDAEKDDLMQDALKELDDATAKLELPDLPSTGK